jgi:hypothetical protein
MQLSDRTRIVRGRHYTYAGLRVLAVVGVLYNRAEIVAPISLFIDYFRGLPNAPELWMPVASLQRSIFELLPWAMLWFLTPWIVRRSWPGYRAACSACARRLTTPDALCPKCNAITQEARIVEDPAPPTKSTGEVLTPPSRG